MKVILFNGPPGSGKDTATRFVITASKDKSRFNSAFSKPVKEAAHRLYGIPAPAFAFEEVKDEPRPEFYGITPRQAYKAISELYFKPMHGVSIFGELLCKEIIFAADLKRAPGTPQYEVCVISDSGFREEVESVVHLVGSENVLLVRLHREGHDFSDDTRSYWDASGLNLAEAAIDNDGDLALFQANVLSVTDQWISDRDLADAVAAANALAMAEDMAAEEGAQLQLDLQERRDEAAQGAADQLAQEAAEDDLAAEQEAFDEFAEGEA